MWLLRGLAFTQKSLQTAQTNPSEELSAAFTKGYEGSLKQYHNFVVKGVFAVRLLAPSLDFYTYPPIPTPLTFTLATKESHL
jgi:hypothetical protein